MLYKFRWVIPVAIIGIFLGGIAGMLMTTVALVEGFLIGLEKTAALSVLESSMSLDNAIVVSAILKKMSPFWRKIYATVGLIIGIVIMRFSFPVLIVSFASHLTPWETLVMAVHEPVKYGLALTSHKHEINAFGSSFLLLIALTFLMNPEKDEHWLGFLEKPLAKLGKVATMPLIITLTLLMIESCFIADTEKTSFLFSGMAGVVGYYLVKDGLGAIVGEGTGPVSAVGGFAMFVYIECIDASFSFDGVIGAFAITDNIFQIAIGLGIGAMMVRVFTLIITEKGSLDNLPYLEIGAFLTIFILSLIMKLEDFYKVPDYITGIFGFAIIGASLWDSLRVMKKEKSAISH